MSYHRFPNLREIFQGDLTKKLLDGLGSRDFLTLPCNCRKKADCIYNGKCRSSIIVYQATCLITGKRYIGNTQQHLKTRMQQHTQDVKNLVKADKRSDSFAEHFASLIPKEMERKEISKAVQLKVDILWKGNPLSCVKTFGTRACKLCSKERLEILKLVRTEPVRAINKNNEIYGACRHKPKFHKFCRLAEPALASTDESEKDERVPRPDSTTSTSTASSSLTSNSQETTESFGQREQEKYNPPQRDVLDRFRISKLTAPPLVLVMIPKRRNEDLALAEKVVGGVNGAG